MPEFRMVDCGEVRLRCALEGPAPGTALLAIMVHGFPESWYSWRHQLGPVAAAGYTACAIDVRGYGGSDKPQPVEAYTLQKIAGDLIGLADALAPDQRIVLIGHDWGAPIVWNTAFTNPQRVSAVAGMSVPFAGAPSAPSPRYSMNTSPARGASSTRNSSRSLAWPRQKRRRTRAISWRG